MIQKEFDWLLVRLASPEDILEWSHGSVETPDTINYRTWKPKKKWLFCEVIFGPVKNYECSCGKYKWVRYKWIVCEKCWVEVTTSRVRRERMWHIQLASPVVHIWYYKANPSKVWLLLNLSVKEIEKVLYFVKYVVVDIDEKMKEKAIKDLEKKYEETLKQLEEVYKQELLNCEKEWLKGEKLRQKKEEIEKLYVDNKKQLEQEYSRIKSILANLKVWSTVLESDYRNFLYQYKDFIKFESWAIAILHLLEKIDIDKEISKTTKIFKKLKW